jgi:hypothetical protein
MGRGSLRLWGENLFLISGGELVEEMEEDSVGPAEADDVVFVSGGDFEVGGAIHDIVFLVDHSFGSK